MANFISRFRSKHGLAEFHPMIRMSVTPRRLFLLLWLLVCGAAQAGPPAPFDLAGPTLDVVITRGKTFLPATEVPNLAEGDRIWIRPEFPATQSAHYLMVAVFLSGPTNPPPEKWFFPCKTWTGKCAREGLTVTVTLPPSTMRNA